MISKSGIKKLTVTGDYVSLGGRDYYRIANSHAMPEFFLMPVSASDHWMFISSRGALTAGRRNPDSSLFPYYSADKISDLSQSTGPRTIIRWSRGDSKGVWQPFSASPANEIIQNVYKNRLGNRVCFEEIHAEAELTFRYFWTAGNQFGFVRSCELINEGPDAVELQMLDGVENVLPAGIEANFQMRFSNLGDAYKKSELVEDAQLGVYYLSSIPSDRAEPAESLRATVVWHYGIDQARVLLSSTQVDSFLRGLDVEQETDIRAHRGAYLLAWEERIAPGSRKSWSQVITSGLDQTDVENLRHKIVQSSDIQIDVEEDVARNEKKLVDILAKTDGFQLGQNSFLTHRHLSNVTFNTMRGGYPADGYLIDIQTFGEHVKAVNQNVWKQNSEFIESLGDQVDLDSLKTKLEDHKDEQLLRIGLQYLPFSFGRRHGDPSRPWNAFSIDLWNEDGSPNQSYQGNWRDIFQNWEALSISYPGYTNSMIFRFLNSSTADGYNPYRITHVGFEWESPHPDDPWANIGYWGDHQIIYLLKLLERSRGVSQEGLDRWLDRDCCTYANVPYRIRSYDRIQENPYDTIEFDFALEKRLLGRVEEIGSDGKLLTDAIGKTHQVTLGEKLLLPALVKMTNFVPEGGIWLNTQRPEWNDANNALVGNGMSMVTVYYLRRYFRFVSDWFSKLPLSETIRVSNEVSSLLQQVLKVLKEHAFSLSGPISDAHRRRIVDSLSNAGSDYRSRLYESGLSGGRKELPLTAFVEFFEQSLRYIDHTIKANRREDGLYHSYNLLNIEGEEEAVVEHLYEMLEGQVAVLSSAALTPAAALEVLDGLRTSSMYREDQRSYILYPNRQLNSFLDKNCISAKWRKRCKLIEALERTGNSRLIRKDVNGDLHFTGDLRNAGDLEVRLAEIGQDPELSRLVNDEKQHVFAMFEETFRHRNFTGRSGTFFGYEGLGSIYWHMVSKLLLSVMENLHWARNDSSCDSEVLEQLKEHAANIREGIGACKSPLEYGAFPIDAYSHTPAHAGAQQPGMTGQVKEDILVRYLELGAILTDGAISFEPACFDKDELLQSSDVFEFVDVDGEPQQVQVPVSGFAFTICQVPVIYHQSFESKITTHGKDGVVERKGNSLTADETSSLFKRDGKLKKIDVYFAP